MSKTETFFQESNCLFCGQPGTERYAGNHGRDWYWDCPCDERRDWELAKQALQKAESPALRRRALAQAKEQVKEISRTLAGWQDKVKGLEEESPDGPR